MENPNFTVNFEGDLITRMTHLYSGTEVVTDAPLDNHGKASSFSPTDLVTSALSACMLSIIAIHFKNTDRKLLPIQTFVKKIMVSNPRRIGEIHIDFDFGQNTFTRSELETLERIAHACPVAKSLSSEILIRTNFQELILKTE